MKGSYYTLTPFDSRRPAASSASAAKSSDYNLTPFTSRISADSSSTAALREAADATTSAPSDSTLADASGKHWSAMNPVDGP